MVKNLQTTCTTSFSLICTHCLNYFTTNAEAVHHAHAHGCKPTTYCCTGDNDNDREEEDYEDDDDGEGEYEDDGFEFEED